MAPPEGLRFVPMWGCAANGARSDNALINGIDRAPIKVQAKGIEQAVGG